MGLGAKRTLHLVGRGLCLLLLTWVPLALLSQLYGAGSSAPLSQNFFLDFAAYLQFLGS